MIVFIAIPCHAPTITIAIHAVVSLARILFSKNEIPNVFATDGIIYVKIKLKIYPTTNPPKILGTK